MEKSVFIANIGMNDYLVYANGMVEKFKRNGFKGDILLDKNGLVIDSNGNEKFISPDEAMRLCDSSVIWLDGAVVDDSSLSKAITYAIINPKVKVGIRPFALSNSELVKYLNVATGNNVASDNNELVDIVLKDLTCKKENKDNKTILN